MEGSDKAEALPSVSSSKTKDAETIVEDTAKVQEDVDAAFKETVTRAITKIDVEDVPEKPTLDDSNKTFRTRLVAFWMLTNAGLAVTIENINGLETGDSLNTDEDELHKKQNIYFAIILYSTFALAAIWFTGVSRFGTHYLHLSGLTHHTSSACSTFSNEIFSDGAEGTDRLPTVWALLHDIQIYFIHAWQDIYIPNANPNDTLGFIYITVKSKPSCFTKSLAPVMNRGK
jgi:hypothetical protein